jgi:hypothetical protein
MKGVEESIISKTDAYLKVKSVVEEVSRETEKDKANISSTLKALGEKEEVLLRREKTTAQNEVILSDRRLDLDLKEAELLKKEDRVNKLIELHKLQVA